MAHLVASKYQAADCAGAKRNVTCFFEKTKFPTLMKKLTFLGLFALFLAAAGAQSPAPVNSDQARLVALLREVQAQQTQMAANQTKIDEKLATLAETIRVAKIYSSRGGR